ncbi:MAG: hypothetical protein HYS74_01975 [Parcubacteria group bacterium]|nr:hypothetical protein [Parcubacteria group bacterium]
MRTALIFSVCIFLLALYAEAAPPSGAVKFFIVDPQDSTAGVPVTVTVQARKSNNQVDTAYQSDVTLIASGSATGGSLVAIVNGTGTREINDSVAETVTLSLSDTEGTGLDVSSTQSVVFGPASAARFTQEGFWFRDDDGGETAASGLGDPDLLPNESSGRRITRPGENPRDALHPPRFRLRFAVRVSQAPGLLTPLLEWREASFAEYEASDYCASSGWSAVGGSGRFIMRSSPHFADGASTTQQISGGASYTSGLILESTNPASQLVLAQNARTEYEWSLEDTEMYADDKAFAFRVTNNGASFTTYTGCAAIVFPNALAYQVPPTSVTFSGNAYPGAKITVIEKYARAERPIRKEPVTAGNGAFDISFRGIFQSNYSYGVLVADKEGRTTQAKFFNIDTVSNSFSQKDIFVPPTVDLYRRAVRRGDFIKALGFASPGNKVMVQIENDIRYETYADDEGRYSFLINTARLPFGAYSIRAKQQSKENGVTSDWSPTRSFSVVAVAVPEADFNGDGIINITDWSVFLSRWRADGAERETVDVNRDGKVDISDFGVFLQAFQKER